MNLSDHSHLLKIAIKEGCKTVSDFAEFIKAYGSETRTYTQLSA